MNCQNFVYDEQSSEDYGVIICSFSGSSDGENTAGSVVTMSTVKAPNSNTWLRTNAYYDEQLEFEFSICKNPCYVNSQEDMVFTAEEQAQIMRWLVKKDYAFLSFDQDGFENIFYNAVITVERYLINGQVTGYTLSVVCDAPWGYSEERKMVIDNNQPLLMNTSEEIGYIIPNVTIHVLSNGTVKINNDSYDEETVIYNCSSGETILMTDMMRISTSLPSHFSLYDDFNWNFVKLYNSFNDESNYFTLSNCTLEISWREIRKAVI